MPVKKMFLYLIKRVGISSQPLPALAARVANKPTPVRLDRIHSLGQQNANFSTLHTALRVNDYMYFILIKEHLHL